MKPNKQTKTEIDTNSMIDKFIYWLCEKIL